MIVKYPRCCVLEIITITLFSTVLMSFQAPRQHELVLQRQRSTRQSLRPASPSLAIHHTHNHNYPHNSRLHNPNIHPLHQLRPTLHARRPRRTNAHSPKQQHRPGPGTPRRPLPRAGSRSIHPTAHPHFQDYKSVLPSWTPNLSIPLSTQRIWGRHLHAASTMKPNARLLLSTPDPRILCVKGFKWDEVVAVDVDGVGGDNGEHAGFGHNVPLGWLGLLLQMQSTYVTGCSSRLADITSKPYHTAKVTRSKHTHTHLSPYSKNLGLTNALNSKNTLPANYAITKMTRGSNAGWVSCAHQIPATLSLSAPSPRSTRWRGGTKRRAWWLSNR